MLVICLNIEKGNWSSIRINTPSLVPLAKTKKKKEERKQEVHGALTLLDDNYGVKGNPHMSCK